MTTADRIAIWLTLAVAVLGLYLALAAIHESRDIMLLAEEEKVLPSLEINSALVRESGNVEGVNPFLEFENAHWDVEIHERLKDSLLMRLLMHRKFSTGPDDEYKLLYKLYGFRERKAQARFSQIEPPEIKNILKIAGSDEWEATDQLARILATGYYIRSFKNWDEGKKAVLAQVPNGDDRQRLSKLFDVLEVSGPPPMRH